MGDRYQLVFCGEVLDGQHQAVVRKRLGQAGSFDDAQLDRLFSGKPVIVKREAAPEVAERLQALFRSAGARLRVQPLDVGSAETPVTDAEQPAEPGWTVLPPGSDLLREEERSRPVAAIDLESVSFEVAPPGADLADAPAESAVAAPDVSHLRLADKT